MISAPEDSAVPQAPSGLPNQTTILVFALAIALRAGWGAFRLWRAADPQALEFPDEQQYWLMARSVAAGTGLVDEFGFRATRMPLYPAILSLFSATPWPVIGAKVFHWMAGALLAVLTARLASVLFDRRVGLIAGLWVACDPFLIFFSSLLLTETFFLAALLGLWLSARAALFNPPTERGADMPWVGMGILAALCVHLRESSLGLVVGLLLVLLIIHRATRRVWAGTAVVGLIVAGSLLPWAMRNQGVTGDWCWLTHRGGVSLYDGVGPQANGRSNLGDVQQMPAVRGLSEVEWDRYFRRESIKAICTDPTHIVRLAGVKLARTWNPFPNIETYQSGFVRTCAAAWTLPTFALSVLGIMLLPNSLKGERLRLAVFLLLPAVYVTAVHCLFVGSVRYRLPAMPMLEILAALAAVRCFDRLRGAPSSIMT